VVCIGVVSFIVNFLPFLVFNTDNEHKVRLINHI